LYDITTLSMFLYEQVYLVEGTLVKDILDMLVLELLSFLFSEGRNRLYKFNTMDGLLFHY
jgi:hypothetical protein